MKLSEYLLSGKMINKKAKLLKTIKLNNGEKRKKGDIIYIMKEFENGQYHAEDNDWACHITRDEFEYL
jgi:hypothetical protein